MHVAQKNHYYNYCCHLIKSTKKSNKTFYLEFKVHLSLGTRLLSSFRGVNCDDERSSKEEFYDHATFFYSYILLFI